MDNNGGGGALGRFFRGKTARPCCTRGRFHQLLAFSQCELLFLCKHEAVPTGHRDDWLINTGTDVLNMNHFMFVLTCLLLNNRTRSYLPELRPFLSHIHTYLQMLAHTGKWDKATPLLHVCLVSLKIGIMGISKVASLCMYLETTGVW